MRKVLVPGDYGESQGPLILLETATQHFHKGRESTGLGYTALQRGYESISSWITALGPSQVSIGASPRCFAQSRIWIWGNRGFPEP